MEPLDDDLIGRQLADRVGLDLHAARRRQRRLRCAASGRVVAIADEHDAFLRLVGEERGCQAQRAADVGRALDRHRRQGCHLLEIVRQLLDERIAAERHDAGQVTVPLDLDGLAHEVDGRGSAGGADGVGEVDDEDGGQLVDWPDPLQAGQGEDDKGEQDDADRERDAPAAEAEVMPGGPAEQDGQRDGRDQQEQQLRRDEAEGQAHRALRRRNGRRRPRLPIQPRMRRAPSRS